MASLRQISRLVILVLAGLSLTTFVDLPVPTLPLIVLDSPLTLRLSSPWLVAVVLVILVSAGTDVLLRLNTAAAEAGYHQTAPAWILPGMTTAAACGLIAQLPPLSRAWLLVLLGAGVGLGLILLGELHAADPTNRYCGLARAALTVYAYAMALFVFTAVYGMDVRTILSGTGTALASFLLAIALLRWWAGPSTRVWPAAALAAPTVGLATWRLNHTSLDSLAGGGLLLLVFYLITGLAQQWMGKDFNRQVMAELAVAVVLGLLLIIGLSGRGG